MSIIVTCPSCGHKTKAPDTAAGKTGKCPHCKSPVLVPRAAEEPTRGGPDIGIVEAEVVEAEVVQPPIVPPAIVPPAKRRAPDPIEPIGLADPARSLGGAVEPPPEDRRPCPVCGELIPNSALKCRYCGEILDPALKKAEAKKRRRAGGSAADDDMSTGDYVVAIICSWIGCIAGIIWMIQGKPKGIRMLIISACMTVFWVIVRIIIEASTGGFNQP
jgi:hypothetical protein